MQLRLITPVFLIFLAGAGSAPTTAFANEAVAMDCSAQASALGLHAVDRQIFRARCKAIGSDYRARVGAGCSYAAQGLHGVERSYFRQRCKGLY